MARVLFCEMTTTGPQSDFINYFFYMTIPRPELVALPQRHPLLQFLLHHRDYVLFLLDLSYKHL